MQPCIFVGSAALQAAQDHPKAAMLTQRTMNFAAIVAALRKVYGKDLY